MCRKDVRFVSLKGCKPCRSSNNRHVQMVAVGLHNLLADVLDLVPPRSLQQDASLDRASRSTGCLNLCPLRCRWACWALGWGP